MITRTSCRAFAFCLAVACSAFAQAPALRPPIDTTEWKKPTESSEHLRIVKKPVYSPSYPDLKDYMRVLERFPLMAERGWRANYLGDPNLGFFGDPDHAEMGLRTMGNFVFVASLLASDPAYDPAVTGISQEHLLARARSGLAYMVRSHVTGDITCGDGKKWGNHWQSAWWTAKMALGAGLIWERLTPVERKAVERVVVHETNRYLDKKAPGGALRDTKSEENAWQTEVMATAVAMFPQHPNAAAWRAKLVEFYLNALSTPADAKSDEIVDGRPLKEQVYTSNINSDYTLENHGAYHFCYMACPLHSIAWGHYALLRGGQPVPQAQFHHFRDVWERAKPTFLDTRFAYMAGKDWPRYGYGLYFIMPALVVLENEFGDADARMIEARRFRTFEEEQLDNADGNFFGKRFTRNIFLFRTAQHETDCYANLGVAYLLHKLHGKPPIAPPSEAEFERHLRARVVSAEAGLAFVRTPELFASFAWRMLQGHLPTALFIPKGMDSAAEWGVDNLIGTIDVADIDVKGANVEHADALVGDGFRTAGKIVYKKKDGAAAYSHEVSFTVDPITKTAVIDSRYVADADVVVRDVQGLSFHVANDFFNGGRRTWTSEQGVKTVTFPLDRPPPETETPGALSLGRKWVNLDGRIGLVSLTPSDGAFVLKTSNIRNARFASLHYDVLTCTPSTGAGARTYHAGEEILHTRFLVLVGNAQQTATASAAALP